MTSPKLSDAIRVMSEVQGGRCKACESVAELVADHCHKTGYLRGLICTSCNIVLGRAQDNKEALLERSRRALALAAYLDEGVTDVVYRKPRWNVVSRENGIEQNESEKVVGKFPQGPSWLAKQLNTTPQTISTWKARNRIPRWWRNQLVDLAEKHDIALTIEDFGE